MNIYDNPNNNQPDCPIRFWNVEEWRYITRKSVPDIESEELYKVSSFGRVYSIVRGKIFVPAIDTKYCRVPIRRKGYRTRYESVHRIVKIEFDLVDNYQHLVVNHLDSDKTNNFIWNLDWATHSQNNKYSYMVGNNSGVRNYHGCINIDIADKIGRDLFEQKMTQKEISKKYNVSEYVVCGIFNGKNWKDIYEKYELYKINNKNKRIILDI